MKVDSIVDKQRDLLKTCLMQSRIYEKNNVTCYHGVLSAWFHF